MSLEGRISRTEAVRAFTQGWRERDVTVRGAADYSAESGEEMAQYLVTKSRVAVQARGGCQLKNRELYKLCW